MGTSFYRSGFKPAFASHYLSSYNGGSNPSAIPTTGLVLRLRADNITQSGGVASKISDISVSANDATASGAGRPTVVASALNGKAGLQFDGTNTFMVGSANPVAAGADRHIFFIGKHTATTNNGGVYFGFRTGGNDEYHALGIASTPYTVGGGAANATLTSGSWAPNTYGLFETRRASNVGTVFLNGSGLALTGAGALSSDNGTAGYTVGGRQGAATQGLVGVECELIVYDHVLSAPDLASVKAYVRLWYGLTIV